MPLSRGVPLLALALQLTVLVVRSGATASVQVPGATFGNGLAGVPICGTSRAPVVVVEHTLQAGEAHGIMHHFWVTGAAGKIDRMHVEYYVDGEATPSVAFQVCVRVLCFVHRLCWLRVPVCVLCVLQEVLVVVSVCGCTGPARVAMNAALPPSDSHPPPSFLPSLPP